MINPHLLRNELNMVAVKLARRGFKLNVDLVKFLEQKRKKLQVKTEALQAQANLNAKYIGQVKERGEDIKLFNDEANILNEHLKTCKKDLKKLNDEILSLNLTLPNIPDDSVPDGQDISKNKEIYRWGKPNNFDFPIKDHITLGEQLNGIIFSSAVKITGSRFAILQGNTARLHRALSQFMLDIHIEQHGYTETYVPYLVNKTSLYSTGQLPKFGHELFHVYTLEQANNFNYSLIPTAEVPLINLVRDEILDEKDLPIKLTAHTPCFRSEAGSYGRDSRGLIRMHQFDKVELIQIVTPHSAMQALEELVNHAEKILQLLKLPYRKVLLCSGDMSFGATKSYDLEVWLPAKNNYCEISSCSNMSDFQARRMHTRYRNLTMNNKTLVHTLNGSGLAVGRTLIAILENYQQKDGSIKITEVLCNYMNGLKYIY